MSIGLCNEKCAIIYTIGEKMFRTLIFILLFALSGCSAIAELETKTEAKEAKKKALEFLVGKGIDDINAKNSWREKETLHDGEDECGSRK